MARTNRKLQLESLETRTLMAGDVSAALANGQLVLDGDNDDNRVEISELHVAGFDLNLVTIKGLDGTTINGLAQATFVVKNSDDVIVDLDDGDDRLFIHDFKQSLAGADLRIDLGDDDDLLQITDVFFAQDIDLDGGSDDDLVTLQDVRAGRDLLVALGSGDDRATLNDTDAGDDTEIRGNDDEDQVVLVNADSVDQLFIDLGNGDDVLDARASNAARFDVNGNDGFDVLRIRRILNGDDIGLIAAARNFEQVVRIA